MPELAHSTPLCLLLHAIVVYISCSNIMAVLSLASASPQLLVTLLLLSAGLINAKPVLEGAARIVDGDTLYIGEFK